MKSYTVFVAVLGLAIGTSIVQCAPSAADVDCSKFESIYDDLGAAQGWSFLSTTHLPPRQLDVFKKQCADSEDAIKTLRIYNAKCNTALTKQVVSAILESRQATINEFCNDNAKSEQAVAAINCLYDKVLDKVKESETRAIVVPQVLHDTNVADEKERLKRACCSVLDNKNHFLDSTKGACDAHKSTYEAYIDSYTSSSMSLICPDAEKLAKSGECASMTPLKTEGVTPKNMFFLSPTIRVVKSLDHPSA